MFQAFLIKYGEIGVKGKNRYVFEDALVTRMKQVLYHVDGTFHISKEQGRIYVEAEGEFDYEETVAALQRVFGIVGICPVVIVEDNGFEDLAEKVGMYQADVSNIESGKANPSISTLQRLADGLGMRLNIEFLPKE